VGTGITENLQVEVLKKRIKGNEVNGSGSDDSEYLFRSMTFEQNFRITLALSADSGTLRAFVIGINENGLSISGT